MLDLDMAKLVQDLLRRPRTRSEVANLLAAFATHYTMIGLERPAERFRIGAALVAANDSEPAPARMDDAAA